MIKNKNQMTFLVAAACVAAVLLVRIVKPNPEEALKKRIAERSMGSEKAPLWVTEYFDYQCPPCATAQGVLEKAFETHPEMIYLQARYYPLPAHKNAMKAALYAECASRQKGKFWAFHKELFKNQKDWALDPYAPIKFAAYAQSAGLNIRQLDACSHDPETEKTVIEEKKKGEELGVKITPSFFVNGKLVVGVQGLKDAIEAHAKERTP